MKRQEIKQGAGSREQGARSRGQGAMGKKGVRLSREQGARSKGQEKVILPKRSESNPENPGSTRYDRRHASCLHWNTGTLIIYNKV